MPATDNLPVSITLNHRDQERLLSLAEAQGRKPNILMKEAVSQYLDREEQRESILREALASWQEFQESGQHLTGEEIATWLDGWGTAAETEIPACHG